MVSKKKKSKKSKIFVAWPLNKRDEFRRDKSEKDLDSEEEKKEEPQTESEICPDTKSTSD